MVHHEAAREAPLGLGADTVVTSQEMSTLTERLLEPDQRGYDVILDTLWGVVIPEAVEATARGARVVHLGNSAGALATLAGPALRKNGVSILTYGIFTLSARERSDAFARLAEHAMAGELTVEYREIGPEAASLSRGFLTRELSPEAFLLTSGNDQNLFSHTGDRLVFAYVAYRALSSMNEPIGRKKS